MVRLELLLGLAMISGIGAAGAQAPPLPPPRPQDTQPTTPAPMAEPLSPSKEAVPPQAGAEPDLCLGQLQASGFEVEAAEQPSTTNQLCRIGTPVRLKAVPVRTRAGAMVRLADQPILACRFADAFGRWLGDLVAPAVAGSLNTEVRNVRTGPGFECRNRNGAATGKLSAHAEGLAIDISAFELSNGSSLRIKPEGDTPPDPTLSAIRTAACGWFTTILGPGSDAAHSDHLHVDIQQHGSSDRYRICQ